MDPDQRHKESPGANRPAVVLRLLLPVVVLATGAVIAGWLMQSGPKAKPRPQVRNAVAVEVRPIEFGAQTTTISVMGTVRPKNEVALNPQVSGRVVSISEKLVPGEHFTRGETLLTIEPADYRLAVQQLTSEVARAEADLQIELGRQRVALKEYELLGETVSDEERDLMLRVPQLESSKASLEEVKTRLAQARLDLERTVVKAPFRAVLITREVDLGASVTPSTTLATLVGSETYWVEAPIAASLLKWIRIGQQGSAVRVYDAAAWGPGRYREGRTTGMAATVETQGRMVELLIEVTDPLALANHSQGLPKLLLGSYVRVEIEGATLPHATMIERDLIRDGDRVWIMDDQGNLDIRPVEIAFRARDHVLVTAGVNPGEMLVISNLPAPVQGMALRIMSTENTPTTSGSSSRP
jgi:RND family efflux transporter MFP subunit